MNIEDILLSNIEYNKTAEESDKRPEKILRFFRLFGVKNKTEEEPTSEELTIKPTISDDISNYNNIYTDNESKWKAISINDILNSISINGTKKYSSITELKNDTDNIINQINEIIQSQFISDNEFNNPNSDFNKVLSNYKNGDSDNIYIASSDFINDLKPSQKTYIPKDYYIYSEIDKDNILNKFNQINNEEI